MEQLEHFLLKRDECADKPAQPGQIAAWLLGLKHHKRRQQRWGHASTSPGFI
jgi:hypothetical protein